jgi:hypothetical protein
VFRLDSPDQCPIVPPGCWRVIRNFESHAVVGVLASTEYDASDYISEYDDFRGWESENSVPIAVPYLDLARSPAEVEVEVDAALLRVVRSGRYMGGPEVAGFEQAFAAYCGAARAIGVGSRRSVRGRCRLGTYLRSGWLGDGATPCGTISKDQASAATSIIPGRSIFSRPIANAATPPARSR